MPEWLRQVAEGTILSLHVQPRASKNEIVGEQDGALKVRLTSPPVEGAANKLCCEFIAKTCGVPKRDVSIVTGEKSRHKRVLVSGLPLANVQARISGIMKPSISCLQ